MAVIDEAKEKTGNTTSLQQMYLSRRPRTIWHIFICSFSGFSFNEPLRV
jgi:hypothetical protein